MAEGNAHDSKTLEATLRQFQTLTDLLGVQVGYPIGSRRAAVATRNAGAALVSQTNGH